MLRRLRLAHALLAAALAGGMNSLPVAEGKFVSHPALRPLPAPSQRPPARSA